ncbi:S1C family serine protease [Chloroflexota bacterium]
MKRIFIALLLMSLVIGTMGCLLPLPTAPTPSPPESETPPANTPGPPIDTSWSPPQPKSEAPTLPSIADVVEEVYPSVVAISTEVVTLDIFRTPRTQKGAGSGWIIDKDGLIVTNNHVIEGAEKVTVELSDGRIFEADPQDIHTDPLTDLAVIKIDATNLPAASVGDSAKLRVGDWVVAIGNPLGQGLRAKEGTVSGLKVSLDVDQGETLGDLIETSAAINPGNSGGPLVNMKGEVIGITSAKIAAVGVEGLGYAISTKTAIPTIEQLIKQGYVTRPWLGVTLYTVDPYVAMVNRLPVSKGVVVAYVKPGSPAAEAELQQLDVITRFKGKEVTTAEEIINAIHNSNVGEEISITFVRGNETKTTSARLLQSPPPGS